MKRHLTDGVGMLPVLCQVIVSCQMFRCVSCFVFDFFCLFYFFHFVEKICFNVSSVCVCIIDFLL